MTDNKAVLMVAGEASADLHGAWVVRELKRRYPAIRVFGIGGPLMQAEGFEAIATSDEISVMGLTEVVHALPRIIGVGRRLLAAVDQCRPQVAVLLDLPDFNLRLAGFLKKRRVPILYYISPQVWAWRQGRVRKIKKLVDRMLVILPFEVPFYQEHGVPATFVGHPLVEEQQNLPDQTAARRQLALPESGPVVALLPGSRRSEVGRHIGPLLAAAQLLYQQGQVAQFVLPIATAQVEPAIRAAAANYSSLPLTLVTGQAQEAILASDVVAVCSGTATLQTALLGRPMVVFYRLSSLSYRLLVKLVKVQAISLVNLIAGKPLIRELIQDDFTPQALAAEVSALLEHKEQYDDLQKELIALKERLGQDRPSLAVVDNCEPYLQKCGEKDE